MVLRLIAAGRLSGRFRRSGSLCAASRGDGGGEPAGRVPVFLSFRTEGFPNSLRTISGEVSCRFAVCLSVQWRALLFVLFLVYPHVLLDAPQSAACERCIAEPQEKLLFAHCEPLPIRNRQRVEQGIEMRRAVHGGFLVVGTAALAAIAAEDPSVEVGQGAVGLLSIVRQEMQRFVSITLGATMAPVGQLSRQFRQRPQRAPANGASYWSDGRVSTNSPSRT